jgi:hypothetical protein
MRTYEDTFSGQKIYPGKVRKMTFEHPRAGVHLRSSVKSWDLKHGMVTHGGLVCIAWKKLAYFGRTGGDALEKEMASQGILLTPWVG